MSTVAAKYKKIKLAILGILLGANFLIWNAYFSVKPDGKLSVIYFDVGQGDSSFIETPEKKQILIDGGPDNSVLAKIGRAMPFFDRSIDLLIITHPDSDHLSGAVEVMKNYDIGTVLVNGKNCSTKICAEFDKTVREKNVKVVVAKAGQKIDFRDGTKMDIFMPRAQAESGEKTENNNFSIISQLKYSNDSFLFMGDAETKEEFEFLSFWPDLAATVLKIGHHGSKNSTAEILLDKVKPKISIISVGADNKYGHPATEVLDRLKKIGDKILRTDIEGDIEIESGGAGVVVRKQ